MDRMNSSARCARCGAPVASLGEYWVHRAPSDHAAEPEWPAAPLRSAEADVLAGEVRRLRRAAAFWKRTAHYLRRMRNYWRREMAQRSERTEQIIAAQADRVFALNRENAEMRGLLRDALTFGWSVEGEEQIRQASELRQRIAALSESEAP